MTILWLCVTILMMVAEFVTTSLISIWFVGGSIVALILSFFEGVGWTWQVLAFVMVSMLLLIFARPSLKKILKIGHEERSNVDGLISKKVRMLSDATFDNLGTAKINDVIWNVKSADERILEKGSIVEIVGIAGNKLIAKPSEEDEVTATK